VDINQCFRKLRVSLAHVVRFVWLSCVAFAGLLLFAAAEGATLWLAGVDFAPKSAVVHASFGDFSISVDGRRAVSLIRFRRRAADNSFESNLVLHSLDEGTVTRLPLAHLAPACVAMAPAGNAIAFASGDGTIYLYSISAQHEPSQSQLNSTLRWLCQAHDEAIVDLVFSPNGASIAAVGAESISLLNCTDGELLRTWPVVDLERSPVLSFSQDSRRLLSYSGGTISRLWSTVTGKLVATAPLPVADAIGAVLSPNGCVAKFIDGYRGVQAWSFDAAKVVPCESWTSSIISRGLPPAFSWDRDLVATTSGSHIIELHNLSTGEQIGRFRAHESQISGLVFGSDCCLYTWDIAGTIRKWKVGYRTDQLRSASEVCSERTVRIEPLLAAGF
jgi:WD40 repeat protein